jgi:hypothetical protein
MSSPPVSRVAAALVLGLGALVAAAIAAYGPAVPERAIYTWPPAHLPDAKPTRTWFAPLFVARPGVESFDATLPCGGPLATLPGTGRRVVLLATARDPGTNHALGVTRSRASGPTSVRIGRTVIAEVPAGAGESCRLRVHLDGTTWSVQLPDATSRRGELGSPPQIFGLVTEVDLSSEPALAVTVRPYAQDTHPSTRQTFLRVLAGALLIAALAVVFRPWRWRWGHIRRCGAARPTAQDGVVVGVTAGWWLLAPLQVDDGWVRGRQLNSLVSGGFSNYYDDYGANLPLATWYEWIQHFVMTGTDSLAVHRLFPLACVVATWFVARWCLVELSGRRPSRTDMTWWVAAAVFAIGATAFGMTLRGEPTIALLVVAVLACCIRYLQTAGTAPLMVAVLLSGTALTIHPSGAVALSPLFVCLPRVVGDARRRSGITVVELAAVASVGMAWATLLAVVDFDLSAREDSIALIQDAGHSSGIVQENERYEALWQWGASPPRRELVALLVLSAAIAFVAWRRKRDLLERLPSASIAIGLLLLVLAPSKWIWHFGVFIGLAVVAIGLESDRFDRGQVSARTRWVAAGVLLAISLFATSEVESWGLLDGSGVDWDTIPFLRVTGATALGALLLERLRAGRSTLRPEAVVVVAVAVALTGATTATLAAAAVSSGEWTAARQVGLSLTGHETCGIADNVRIPNAPSLDRLQPLGQPATVRADPRAIVSTRGSRWYRVRDRPIGVFIRGDWDRQRLVVSWGRKDGTHVRAIATGPADLSRAQVGAIGASWWFVTEASFPERPPGADVVRTAVTNQGSGSDGDTSQPYSYKTRALSGTVGRDQLKTLSSPYLFEALPCATLPQLELGVAEPPDLLIDGGPPPLTIATSPFRGITDLFTVWKAPVESQSDGGSPYPWEGVSAYWVIRDPRDAIAPAMRRQVT